MNPMNQREHVLDDLKAYLDGQLGPAQRLAVRLHLARCPLCRKEMTTMEQIGTNLRESDTGGLDAVLRARILAAIPADEDRKTGRQEDGKTERRAASGWRRGLVPALGALAIVGLAVVVYPALNMNRLNAPAMDSATSSAPVSEAAKSAGANMAQRAYPKEIKQTEMARTTDAEAGSAAKIAQPQGAAEAESQIVPTAKAINPAAPGLAYDSAAPNGVSPRPSANAPSADSRLRTIPFANRRQEQQDANIATAGKVANAAAAPAKPQFATPAQPDVTTLTIPVEQTTSAAYRVTEITQSAGGYVVRDQRGTKADASRTATLTLQVPATQISAVISQIRSLETAETRATARKAVQPQASPDASGQARRFYDGHTADKQTLRGGAKDKTTHTPTLTTLRVMLIEKPK